VDNVEAFGGYRRHLKLPGVKSQRAHSLALIVASLQRYPSPVLPNPELDNNYFQRPRRPFLHDSSSSLITTSPRFPRLNLGFNLQLLFSSTVRTAMVQFLKDKL
jgi:hypothetical protein